MCDYVRQRPSPTISLSSLSYRFVRLLALFFMFFNQLSYCLNEYETPRVDRNSLQKVFQLRNTQLINLDQKKMLRIIYFLDFDKEITEDRLVQDARNLTEQFGINLKVSIINQSKLFAIKKICSLISEEKRDTIIIADLYTKEIDLISRSLKVPTIAITNRYQIVHGKLHNPYLFKLMPDAIEEAKTVALAIDTNSVYRRIAILYDISLDMVEFRLSYLRLAKQHIVYRAQLPRVSMSYEFRRSARTIIHDLLRIEIDLIFCIMSTEREVQFVRLIKEMASPYISQLLLNRTSWWFASRLDEAHGLNYFPKIITASEDRRRTLSQFSRVTVNILLSSILKTYIRLPNISVLSSSLIGPSTCDMRWNAHQLRKTQMFIKLFTNFTEWNCDTRLGSGVDPLLFEPKTLAWRLPTMFMVHAEHLCQGMLTRTFYTASTNADQIFRSCRQAYYTSRKGSSSSSSSSQQDNSTSGSTTLLDLNSFHRKFTKLWNEPNSECRFVQIDASLTKLIVVGVVEPPYIFVSDAQISSEFHCNYGIPCYKVDPPLTNMTLDALFFQSKTVAPPHCCYGISVNLFLRMEDSNSVSSLKSTRLFVFADKPNKWVALIKALENRRAHLSISAIPYESSLARGIDLSPPFYHSSYVIFTAPIESRSPLGVFLQPFSWTTWCMIFLVLNAAALFETFFEWHSPYGLTPKGRRRQKVFSLASALTLTWSIVFSHTFKTKSPKCWSNRFLGNVWGGFGIFFIAIYTAKLAAFMVEIAETQSATNVEGIVDACRKTSECSIGVVANTSDEEYMRRSFTNTLYTHMRYVPSYAKGIDLLRTRAITHLLMDHSMARYYLTREVFKSIRISGDNFGSFGLSLGFAKFETELKTNINHILLSYVDKGIIQRLHDDWYIYENCELKRLNDNQKLSVDRFIGVFILLGTGMVLGFVTLILEWVTFKLAVPYWRKRQWPGWMFASQRLYASLNASDEVFTEAYRSVKLHSSRCVGERLHNYSTRSDSLDLRVVDVPKLICTTYQLKEQMSKINEQHQQQSDSLEDEAGQNDQFQQQLSSILPQNDRLYFASMKEQRRERRRLILTRIDELEQELNQLKSQLSTSDNN